MPTKPGTRAQVKITIPANQVLEEYIREKKDQHEPGVSKTAVVSRLILALKEADHPKDESAELGK